MRACPSTVSDTPGSSCSIADFNSSSGGNMRSPLIVEGMLSRRLPHVRIVAGLKACLPVFRDRVLALLLAHRHAKPAAFDPLLQLGQALQQRLRSRRAAGDVDIDGDV